MNPSDQITLQKNLCIAFDIAIAGSGMEEFRQQLAVIVNDLIIHDFNKLVSILYRVDVSEHKMKKLLKDITGQDSGLIIADALIARQLEKLANLHGKEADPGIPDNEKW